MTDRSELERQIAELQAKLAALPQVDPLRLEARKVCEDHGFDNHFGAEESLALAALRRGMELGRVPAAAWPDKDTVQKMAARITAEYPDGSWTDDLLIEMARRIKAHMTGGAA